MTDGSVVLTGECHSLVSYKSSSLATDPGASVRVTLQFQQQSISGIRENVDAAQAIVDQKQVLLDKLGRARGIVDKIVQSRELAMSTDVSAVLGGYVSRCKLSILSVDPSCCEGCGDGIEAHV